MQYEKFIVDTVLYEVDRQDKKWGADRQHPDTYPNLGAEVDRVWYHMYEPVSWYKKLTDERSQDGTISWADILLEEVAEALDETDPEKLAAELAQVAAVALQWMNDLAIRAEG